MPELWFTQIQYHNISQYVFYSQPKIILYLFIPKEPLITIFIFNQPPFINIPLFFIMGCSFSEVSLPFLSSTLYDSKSPIVDNLSENGKIKLVDLIESDDILNLPVTIEDIKGLPQSAISDLNWMTIHLCCRWDADNCLQFLLKDYFIKNPQKYIDFVNAPTLEGYTTLHICGMYKSEKCFFVLHTFGGLNLNAKDKSAKTPLETAVSYRCKKMEEILKTYKKMEVNFTQIETKRIISEKLIAEDIIEVQKKKKNPTDSKQIINNNKTEEKVQITEMEKLMLEQKRRLEQQKEKILRQKIEAENKALELQNRLLEQERKRQTEYIEKINRQKEIRDEMEQKIKEVNQKAAKQVKAKDEELTRVKDELKLRQQQRILLEKDKAQKKAEEIIQQKQRQIERLALEKDQAIANLKRQQEQRRRAEEEGAKRMLKEVEQAYSKKLSELKKVLQIKQSQIDSLKRQEEEWKRKERNQSLSKQALAQKELQFRKKLKEKEDQIACLKKQETEKLNNQRQQAEKRVVENHRKQIQKSKSEPQQKPIVLKEDQKIYHSSIIEQAFMKANQKLDQNIKTLYEESKAKGNFIDKQFPPNFKSLGDPSKIKSHHLNQFQNSLWFRPKVFLKTDFQVFDGIDPNDISQGSLGVCYLLATLSSLASNPKNIQRIFVFSDTNIGFYVLKLHINGVPKLIIIDDYIPCDKVTKTPIFTKPIGNQIWVLLLQKAWAKVVGDYTSAESMTPEHAMEDFSGAPCFGKYFKNQIASEVSRKLLGFRKSNSSIVITSGKKLIQGIVNNHAYSLLQCYQFRGRYIFKIRNPWGNFQWNGQYGVNSSLWTVEMKRLVGYQDADNGVFHISESELFDAFDYYSVCQLSIAANYSYEEFSSRKYEDLYFKVSIQARSNVNMRVLQRFKRLTKDNSYEYSPFVFQIGKINGQKNVTFISQGVEQTFFGQKSVHAFQNIIESLDTGEYFVRLNMQWKNQAKYNSGVFAVNSSNTAQISRINKESGMNFINEGQKYKIALFQSFASKSARNKHQQGFYKIVPMKGQFLFVGEVEKEGKYNFSVQFTLEEMVFCEPEIGKISSNKISISLSKSEVGIGTARRFNAANGGTPGGVVISLSKI